MKKYIAFLLVVVMTLSMSVSVAATTADIPRAAGGIEGVGQVVDADLEPVIRMTLPTEANFEFFLDPAGMLGQGPGRIVFPSFSPAFISRSSTDLKLGVEYTVGGNITHVRTSDEVASANQGVAVGVVSSSVNVNDPAVAFEGSVMNYVYGNTANYRRTLFEYALPAAYFVISGTGDNARLVPYDEPNWKGTQIQLRGALNSNPNNWTGTVNMSLNIRYSFTGDVTLASTAVNRSIVDGTAHLRRVLPGEEVFQTAQQTGAPLVPVGFRVDGFTVGTVEVTSAGAGIARNIPIYPTALAPDGVPANTLVTRVQWVPDVGEPTGWQPSFPWFLWGGIGTADAFNSLNLVIAPGVTGVIEIELRDSENLRVYVVLP